MENEIVSDYSAYKERIKALLGDQRVLVTLFADYAAGSFGAHVVEGPESLPESPAEKSAVLEELRASAWKISFFRFGVSLSPVLRTAPSLRDLLSATGLADPYFLTPDDGMPTIVDYSQSSLGRSVLTTVTHEAFTSASRDDRIAASMKFTGLAWPYVLKYEVPPSSGPSVPSPGFLPPHLSAMRGR